MEAPPFAGRYAPAAGFADGWPTLLGGILFPAFTIALELLSRLCAEALFDPLPTLAHLGLVAAVPILNLKLWLMRRRELPIGRGWLFAAGVSVAVSLTYSILFLPIYPIAALGILYFGLGLLVFAPLLSGLSTMAIVVDLAHAGQVRFGRVMTGGLLAGLLAMLALDLPAAITGQAIRGSNSVDAHERERAIILMRRFGSRELLLRYCYEQSGRSGGLLALILDGSFRFRIQGADGRGFTTPTEVARQLYYRVTGFPYDSVPPPWDGTGWRFAREFRWDPDQGGTQVGGRLEGLSLANSRIDASMDADDAVAYVEWTTEFQNSSRSDREARMTVALPPGAVISRATLWVHGEEREAVFASRAEARAAYEAVVQRRRDPLLITTNGADQALVQMFPVPSGSLARIRLGITAPLALSADDRATLVLPVIADRNFSIDGTLHHAVWVEGDGREAVADAGFLTIAGEGSKVRRRASFTDVELTTRRPRISLSRNPKAESLSSGDVLQTILREPREPAGSLFVLLDGSKRAAPARAGLLSALDRIPLGSRVGFGIASSSPVVLPLAPWTPMRRTELIDLLEAQPFDGGEDNVGVLAAGLAQLDAEPRATLLWVHAPQGHAFTTHSAELEQVMDRGTRLPELWLLPVEAGPNKVLRDPRLFVQAHTLAWSEDIGADIGAALTDYFDPEARWTIRRVRGSSQGVATGSAHVEKLWALQEVEELLARRPADRERAIEIAATYRLVTPVSGAVVLESDEQYRAAGLTPPDPSAVPTIPEPETWALIIIACLAFAWVWRKRPLASA
jgi:hypothetical protein